MIVPLVAGFMFWLFFFLFIFVPVHFWWKETTEPYVWSQEEVETNCSYVYVLKDFIRSDEEERYIIMWLFFLYISNTTKKHVGFVHAGAGVQNVCGHFVS